MSVSLKNVSISLVVPDTSPELVKYNSVTPTGVLGNMPHRELDPYSNAANEAYGKLTTIRSYPYVLRYPNQNFRDYVVAGPLATGRGVNAFLYYISPNKNYGLDTQDIVGDGRDLYANASRSKTDEERLARHRKIPGWGEFDKYHRRIIEAIARSKARDGYWVRRVKGETTYRPLARWRKFDDGTRKWQFDWSEDNVGSLMTQDRRVSPLTPQPWSSLLGLYYMAALSPDVTKGWPNRVHYPPDVSRGESNAGGALQSLILPISNVGEILNGRLIGAYENYMESGLHALPSAVKGS